MTEPRQDSPAYLARKAFLKKLLTVYGRKPVLEALQDASLPVHRVHLADSNSPAPILNDIQRLARQRGVEVLFHGKRELSRISKNAQQDQGVAADILCPNFHSAAELPEALDAGTAPRSLLVVDGVTNPQNLGMIIRAATAGHVGGLLLGETGTAALGPLVIKASAGTLFRAHLWRSEQLAMVLAELRDKGAEICVLSSHAKDSLFDHRPRAPLTLYVLGNETEGVSQAVECLANTALRIPMANGVESLNVAVTAGLIAFLPALQG